MAVNDYCRFCNINLRIQGVLGNCTKIFDKTTKAQYVFDRLRNLGLILRDCPSKSRRICRRCDRLIARLQTDLPVFTSWKEKEETGFYEEPTTSTGAVKRPREPSSPPQTPGALKKVCPGPDRFTEVMESDKKDALHQRLKIEDELTTTNQSENRDIKEEDEELSISLSVGDGRYQVDLGSSSEFVVDEECILQLFKSCRECNRQCSVRKCVSGLKLVVSQVCCFCESSFKWTNLLEDDEGDLQINGKHEAHEQNNADKQ